MFLFKNYKKKCKISKREIMIYLVIFLWVIFGFFIAFYTPKDNEGNLLEKVSFASMAIYFVSLTGFVGAYMYSETVKPDKDSTTIFLKGKSDKREIIVYVCILFWGLLGFWGIIKSVPLDEIGAYFGALTPFVAAYVLGQSARKSNETGLENIEE
jgi:succinate-acetate transporter protein